ncbi:hypothetical protein ColTof4_02033 [Colletotrichum tofieldiae]|nr:hypothetical protein ColTof4_02033 [Colletotrichum tofieldiae]GKT92568.1 hypothetical protein Ct61P_10418 [Colletotrichum tofieldiae]
MLSFILDSNDLPRIVFKDKVYVQFRGCQGVPGRLPPKKSSYDMCTPLLGELVCFMQDQIWHLSTSRYSGRSNS